MKSKLISSILASSVILTSLLAVNQEASASQKTTKDDAYVSLNAYKNETGAKDAEQKAKLISNSRLHVNKVNKPDKTKFQAVGVIKDEKNQRYATAFAIGKRTIITNNHVVLDKTQNNKYISKDPKQFVFKPSKSNLYEPYKHYKIKDIKMIKGLDIAVLHTEENLPKSIKPMKLASEKEIKSLKRNDRLYAAGYPSSQYLPAKYGFKNLPNGQMYTYSGYYLQSAYSIDPQFYSKMIIRKGSSGSPILDKYNRVVGVNSNGFNITDKATWSVAPYEMAFVQQLTGKQRHEIEKLKK